jgi:hypothetical protein
MYSNNKNTFMPCDFDFYPKYFFVLDELLPFGRHTKPKDIENGTALWLGNFVCSQITQFTSQFTSYFKNQTR